MISHPTDPPIKKFQIRNKEKVIGVGLRAKLIAEANKRNLKIRATNLDDRVEVVVSGHPDAIEDFYKAVCKSKEYTCSELVGYPYSVDWSIAYQGYIAEQIGKFVNEAKVVKDQLFDISVKLDSMNAKLDNMNTKLDKLDSIEKILLRIERKL